MFKVCKLSALFICRRNLSKIPKRESRQIFSQSEIVSWLIFSQGMIKWIRIIVFVRNSRSLVLKTSYSIYKEPDLITASFTHESNRREKDWSGRKKWHFQSSRLNDIKNSKQFMQNFIESFMSEARTYFILLPLQVSLLRRKYVKKIIFKKILQRL